MAFKQGVFQILFFSTWKIADLNQKGLGNIIYFLYIFKHLPSQNTIFSGFNNLENLYFEIQK